MLVKNKISYLALITAAALSYTDPVSASLSTTDINAVVGAAPTAVKLTASPAWPKTDQVLSNVDAMRYAPLGTASKTTGTVGATGTAVPFSSDLSNYTPPTTVPVAAGVYSGDNFVFCDISTGGVQRSFKSSAITADFSATTALVLTEYIRDGATSPGSPYTITITLTKTGTPAALTLAALNTYLRATAVRSLSTLTGTGIALGGVLATGWAATALAKDGSAAATAVTLDDSEVGFTLPITVGGVVGNFRTTLKARDYNFPLANTTVVTTTFGCPELGSSFLLDLVPGNMAAHTNSISANILTALTDLSGKKIYTAPSGTVPPLTTFANSPATVMTHLSSLVTSGSDTLAEAISTLAKANVSDAGMAAATDFPTAIGTTLYGALVLGDTDITSITNFRGLNGIAMFDGKVGVSASAVTFSCDLTGLATKTISSTVNPVLVFTSLYGQTAFFKSFDASTGPDATAIGGLPTNMQAAVLASLLATALDDSGGTTTIGHMAALDIHP